MSVREENLRVLDNLNYGVEEQFNMAKNRTVIDLYSPDFLFIGQFQNHDELADWISENVKY